MTQQLRGGIDNGYSGAIVAFDENYEIVVSELMPTLKASKSGRKRLDMVRLNAIFTEIAQHPCFIVLEHAQAMPKQGASSGFNYGTTYGAVQMGLISHKIPFEIVTPRKWQAGVGISSGGTKEQAVLICQQRLPTLDLTPGAKRKPDIGLADAAGMGLHAVNLRPFNPRRACTDCGRFLPPGWPVPRCAGCIGAEFPPGPLPPPPPRPTCTGKKND